MADFPFATVLFDLDGTLVDSNLDLAPAVNHALALEGRAPVALADVRKFIGGGAALMLERALVATGGAVSKDRFEELHEALLAHYIAHIADNTVTFAGVFEALDALQALGCKLAMCTNKAEEPARALLDALSLTPYFTSIHGGDTLGRERAKPAPDMLLAAAADCGGGRAAMIGDSTFDVRAAKNAGMPVVAFAGGYPDEPVDELGADAVIAHFDELVGALARL
jgi:phosphoglycolate phosphatase